MWGSGTLDIINLIFKRLKMLFRREGNKKKGIPSDNADMSNDKEKKRIFSRLKFMEQMGTFYGF